MLQGGIIHTSQMEKSGLRNWPKVLLVLGPTVSEQCSHPIKKRPLTSYFLRMCPQDFRVNKYLDAFRLDNKNVKENWLRCMQMLGLLCISS